MSSGLTALLLSAVATSQPAYASCSVSVGGTIVCGNTITTNTTNLNGASAASSDAIQFWNSNTPITASVTGGATVSGFGLGLQEGSALTETITLVNNSGSTIESLNGVAVSLVGNGGNIAYSGDGSVFSLVAVGISASNALTGRINIVTTGFISAGDGIGGDDFGVATNAVNGVTTIDLTGGTIQGDLLDGAGIYARSVGGSIGITAQDIGGSLAYAGTGIDAAISGSGTGVISATVLGSVYADGNAINAQNNNTGGVGFNLNGGANLYASGSGEYGRVTGAGGAITVTNAVGSYIAATTGVDAQILNNADTANVTVHQNGTLEANGTGIIAATYGTGGVLVDGSGGVSGGNGIAALSIGGSLDASGYGIAAANLGTSGSVTVSGTGSTEGTVGIEAFIYNSGNTSSVLVDRSGAIYVSGAGGTGVDAYTAGNGTVTVQNTGAITGVDVGYGINATSAGGAVLVKNVGPISADTSTGYGISANGYGNVTVDGTGSIAAGAFGIFAQSTEGSVLVTNTGAISGAEGTGIFAHAYDHGNVTVTPGSTVSGLTGIDAGAMNGGNVTITTALGAGGNVTGNDGDGVLVQVQDGTINLTNNAALISGTNSGAELSAHGGGVITVTGSGAFAGSDDYAILATQSGVGPGTGVGGIVIGGTGDVSGDSGGIFASITNASNHSNILVDRTGSVSNWLAGSGDGIRATTAGDGNVSVVNPGDVTGSDAGTGIYASSQGGAILIQPAGSVRGGAGVYGATNGAGTVTVTTAFGSLGNVTGDAGDGVQTSAQNGVTVITNNAAAISGSVWASVSNSTGLGTISIQGAGNYVGGTSGGIGAFVSGTGPASGNAILVTGTGTTSATTGVGIDAEISNVANHGNILINRSGAVSVAAGGGSGIIATTAGDGAVTVTGVLGVTAGTGASAIGIDAQSHGGSVLVTPAGQVSGGNGVNATTTGAGLVTVTTLPGTSGNITGLNGFGVNTSAQNGDTVISNNAAAISGTTWASDSAVTGSGLITVQGAGNYVGGTAGGIGVVDSGIGSGPTATAITITGSGNTSATTGYGIYASITNSGNQSDILVNRTGTVSVASGGKSGIVAATSGIGDVTVVHVGNVTAGTNSSYVGIDAESRGGNVAVDLSSPLHLTSTVTGGNGVLASTLGTGTVNVTTYGGSTGNITGVAGFGVETSAVNGDTNVYNNATTISGTTWAERSFVSGTGKALVTGSGDYVGGTGGGIGVSDSGTGPGASLSAILITGSGNTSATTGVGISAVITNNLNDANIVINRSGTTTVAAGGLSGILALTAGTGNISITGIGNVQGGTTGTNRGIGALSSGGDILITPAGTVSGAIGIGAATTNSGDIAITTATGAAGNVTGVLGNGIAGLLVDGDLLITNSAATVSGATTAGRGIVLGAGTATITGSGNYAGGTVTGIWVTDTGTGPAAGANAIVVSGSGNTSATTGAGIVAEITNSSNAANILVNRSGTVNVMAAGGDGIAATTAGIGDVTVTGVGNVTAGTGVDDVGILAASSGGNVLVTPAGTVSGYLGIDAETALNGTVTVTTVGNITGSTDDGIRARSVDGDIAVTTAALTTVASLGSGDGIDARASGLGNVTILANSAVSGDPAVYATSVLGNVTVTANASTTGLLDGIYAGSTSASSTGNVWVGGTGNVTGGTNGIEAFANGSGTVRVTGSGKTTGSNGYGISALSTSGDILVDRTGTISGTYDGVHAAATAGGNITVAGVGNVSGGPSFTGISAVATGGNGNVVVTPAGTVVAGIGIGASAVGNGNVTVTTASGAAGNVTGTSSIGIAASAVNGTVTLTNNAATVWGATLGASAMATGSGNVVVTGSGTYTGDTVGGIYASLSGVGPTSGNGILISGAGNTSATTGFGINAQITYPSSSNIMINRTGTVSVAPGGLDGIDATTVGSGNVTVTGVGNVTAGTGAGTVGIYVRAYGGGNVDVEPAGTVSGDMGIYAHATMAGTVNVVTVGNITGLTQDGIHARAVDGDINVTTATGTTVQSLGTGDGVDARAWGLGNVTILTNSVVNGDPGIYATSAFGNVSVTANATVTGLLDGIYAGATDMASAGQVSVGGTGAVIGGSNGIEVFANGSGNVTVTGSGNTTATGGVGVLASTITGNVLVNRTGTVSGSADGISAISSSGGNVTVTGTGNVTGGSNWTGIYASSSGGNGNVVVTPAGTVSAGQGIVATAVGSGSVTVTTASGAGGNVTGSNLQGIVTNAVDGDTVVTNNAVAVSGASYGAQVVSTGLGKLTVAGSGIYSGGTADGIMVVSSGIGSGAATSGILVTGSGKAASGSAIGIDAEILNAANASNILINRTGTVSGGTAGISAITNGTGDVSVTGVGNVTGGNNYYGIIAAATVGNVSVTPAGTVVSGGGIQAGTGGTGTVTVTTASGAAGNITATNASGPGINTSAVDGGTVVTNNAQTVSGSWAAYSVSLGLGKLTITGSGTYAGTSGGGIAANAAGLGPVAGQDGILIGGAGNTSATTGVGITASITNASNASNIDITRSGTVTVAAGGLDGIDAVTVGTGNVIITGVGNVAAGTGATRYGIKAQAAGGNITINTAGTVSGGGTGISALTTGAGAIGITAANNVTGTALNGIATSAVNGNTLVTVNGGTTSAVGVGYAAVNEVATGVGNLALTVAPGATISGGTTAMAAKLVQSGTGTIGIANSGTITGAGTLANPVIYVSATGTKTITITNNAAGVISSANTTANNRAADMAIYTPATTGVFVISNAGTLNGEIALSNQTNSLANSGTWNVRDNGATVGAAFGTSGSNALTNSGTLNAGNALAAATTNFTGLNTIVNGGIINAGLYGAADVTTFSASGGGQTVTNSGTVNVHGSAAFVGNSTSSFTNAVGLINLRTSGAATTDQVTLNATAVNNTYTPGATYNYAGGSGARLGLDTFVGSASSTGTSVPSDRLVISGTATGSTSILVNDTNTASGAYNPVGITLAAVNGTSSNAFVLGGLTAAPNTAVLQASRGPMGAIKKGFWFYPLLQSTHAEATSDGLTGPNSSEYRLYGLPDVEVFELGLAATGAQNVWYESSQAVTERQQEVRNDWAYGNTTSAPNFWMKVTGSWTERTNPLHGFGSYVSAASSIVPVDTSFNQDLLAVQVGVDRATHNLLADGDQLVVGAGAGYVSSDLDFKSSGNSFGYSGVTLHGSADYYVGKFFLDVMVKGDLLSVDYKFNTLSPFGYAAPKGNADTWGVISNAGFHFALSDNAKSFFEPIVSISYLDAGVDQFSVLGTTAKFTDGDSVRGAIGARLGGVLSDQGGSVLTASLTGRYWDEFVTHTNMTLTSAGPALSFDDNSREKGFGEVGGSLNLSGSSWGGWSGFISSSAKFNNQFTEVQASGGLRYKW